VPPTDGRLFGSFAVAQNWPPLEGGTPKSLAARMLLDYSDPPGQLGIALADPTDAASLDLDFFLLRTHTISPDYALTWLDRAHDRAFDAFRAMVRTDLFESWR